MRATYLLPLLLLLLVGLGLASRAAVAQLPAAGGTGVISGVAISEEGEQPIVAAVVVIRLMSDSTIVASRITDQGGRFRVEQLPAGEYQVEMTTVGRRPYVQRNVVITAQSPTADLGRVQLAAAAVELEGVVARGDTPPMQMTSDRTIYSVRDMPAAAGGVATDVLRTVPDIEVDVEGKITAMGATPAVHLNGRPAPMQGEALTAFLQNLPADRIDRVEYIPNPSARYEAQGQGGILNIVLREDTNLGLSGTLSANAGTRGQQGGNARLNYQEGRLTFFGGGSGSRSSSGGWSEDFRENRITNPVTFLEQSGRSGSESMFGSGDMTAEWKLSSRATLWSGLRGSLNGSSNSGTTNVLHMDAAQHPTDRYDRFAETRSAFFSGMASLGARRVIQSQRDEYSMEVRYALNSQDSDNDAARYRRELLTAELLDLPPDLTDQTNDQDDGTLSLQADLSRPMGEQGRIDVGYRGTFRDLDSSQLSEEFTSAGGTTPVISTPNAFRHRENVNALYLTLDRRIGQAGIQVGLRAEHADTRFTLPLEGQEYDNDYASLFPSANLSYAMGGGRQVRLSYSRRFTRPPTFYLNPHNPSVDPFNRFVGNPQLKPQYSHAFNFESSWTGRYGSLRFAPYFRRTTGMWEQIREVDEQGVSTVSMYNLTSSDTYGTGLTASLRQTGPFSGLLSLQGFRTVRDGSNLSSMYSGSQLSWSTNGNLSVRASPTLNLQFSGFYNPERQVPQGTISSFQYLTLGGRKQLFNNRVAVNFSVVDPLDMYRYSFRTSDPSHQQTSRSSFSMRRGTLSMTYSFGRPPQSSRPQGQPMEGQAEPVDAGGGIR